MSTKPKLSTLTILVIGLWIFGTGDAVIIAAGLGVAPWTVLAQGIGIQFDWTIGQATFFISVIVLFLWIPLKEKPGVGTILNAILIAVVVFPTPPFWLAIAIILAIYPVEIFIKIQLKLWPKKL